MQHKLSDGGAVRAQDFLEIPDLVVACLPNLFRNQFVHARNEHIFVVRSIPNADHALVRRHFVSAPKKIVIEVHLCRCLESRKFKPGRVQAEAKSVERAVFSASIHRLKKNQQTALVLGEQLLLEEADFPAKVDK